VIRWLLAFLLFSTSAFADPGSNTFAAGQNNPPATNALVGYWSFDEGKGSTVYDYSPYLRNGTWTGTLGGQWVVGKIQYGGNFNGTDNYVSGALPSAATTNITLTSWVYITANGLALISYIGTSASNGYGFYLNNGSGASGHVVGILGGGVSINLLTGTATLNLNQWNFLTLVRRGTNWSLYLNCQLSATGTTNPNTPTLNFFIGGNAAGSRFAGVVDEVALWTVPLLREQVCWLYNAGAGRRLK